MSQESEVRNMKDSFKKMESTLSDIRILMDDMFMRSIMGTVGIENDKIEAFFRLWYDAHKNYNALTIIEKIQLERV